MKGHALKRLLIFFGLIVLGLLALGGVAGAIETGGPSITEPAVKDLFDGAQLLAFIGGVLLPFVVALLTKVRASWWVQSAVAVVSAGLLALGLYLADVSGGQTWHGAVSVFVIAITFAAASRYTVTSPADKKLQAATGRFGFG